MIEKNDIIELIHNKIIINKDSLKQKWNNPKNTKTKYLIVDDLLPEDICKEIYNSFPKDLKGFYLRKSFRESKKTSANMNIYDKILYNSLYAFQDKKIINVISEITNIDYLEADEKLYASGLSAMRQGDFLNPHIDNSHNLTRDKYRRLNLLYYVTPEWKIKNGGNFELWDNKVCSQKTIISLFNRLVIMETNKTSWHSVSEVKTDMLRCCLSNYYFSEKFSSKYSEKYYFKKIKIWTRKKFNK